jgi:hypothetical protein
MNNIIETNLITQLGLDLLPQEEREKILLDIGEIIFRGVIMKVMDVMNEKDKNDFEKVLDEANKSEDDDQIGIFLMEKVPNLDAIVSTEVENFKKESLDFMNQIV